MNPLLLILGLVDACGAVIIMWGPNVPILGQFIMYLAYMILVKGLISVFISFPVGFFDWMGILDILAGIVLILIMYGMNFQIFYIFAVIYVFKAGYCLFRTILNI
jgi:hypothetical protein